MRKIGRKCIVLGKIGQDMGKIRKLEVKKGGSTSMNLSIIIFQSSIKIQKGEEELKKTSDANMLRNCQSIHLCI
jgi:hypothetical protein